MTPESEVLERNVQICLVVGIMLLFLTVWKGDGGYLDLKQYLDNTESVWLNGELSKPGHPGQYYIHPLGISVLSGPFMLAGVVIEKVSGGMFGRRAVAAFSIPVFSALACLLVFKTGRELNLSPSVSFFAAAALGVASPFFQYSRLYYGEAGIALGICVANWAFLRARRSTDGAAIAWVVLAGAGLACATACHFNNFFISLILWLAMSAAFVLDRTQPLPMRVLRIAALSVVPILAGGAILYLNTVRFGGPFNTGYDVYMLKETPHPVSFLNVSSNLGYLAVWLLRVPWAIPAFFALYTFFKKEPIWTVGLAASALAQLVFMQTFCGLNTFPIRYHESAVVILSIGLLVIGNAIWKRWQERGLIFSLILMFAFNVGDFIHVVEFGNLRAFWRLGPNQPMLCSVWYMVPSRSPFVPATPMGPMQWAVLAVLALSGSALLVLGFNYAAKISAVPASVSTNSDLACIQN